MPARRFFAMIRAGRKLKNEQYSEFCNIAYIPAANIEYMKYLQEYFAVKNEEKEEKIAPIQKPALSGLNAHMAMQDVFSSLRRIH